MWKKKKKDKRQKERRWLNQKERKECCNGVFMSKMQERFCSQFSFIFFSSISTYFQLLSFSFPFFFFGGASRNSNEIITFWSCEICREKILEKERERGRNVWSLTSDCSFHIKKFKTLFFKKFIYIWKKKKIYIYIYKKKFNCHIKLTLLFLFVFIFKFLRGCRK